MRKKILVAPLNWGLGHAARMIPVIRELERRSCEILIAADGRPLELLRKEFPHLKWFRLAGYDMQYQQRGSFPAKIFSQLPKIIRSFIDERKWLKKMLEQEHIDVIISDNRFGLYHEKVHSVFITHQVHILLPSSWKWAEALVNFVNRYFIGKFDECWIPDTTETNLAGKLSMPTKIPDNAKYIGMLSRMERKKAEKKYDLLVVLSGPEPQRTIFEELIREQTLNLKKTILLVRGVTEGSNEVRQWRSSFFYADFMTSSQLNDAMLSADLIICRSGYSTLMDLAALELNAVFVPTPGQTEQEYLADQLKKKKICYSESQQEFSLFRAITEAASYPGFTNQDSSGILRELLEKLTHSSIRQIEKV